MSDEVREALDTVTNPADTCDVCELDGCAVTRTPHADCPIEAAKATITAALTNAAEREEALRLDLADRKEAARSAEDAAGIMALQVDALRAENAALTAQVERLERMSATERSVRRFIAFAEDNPEDWERFKATHPTKIARLRAALDTAPDVSRA